jgi:hypothetical protein
MYVSIGLHTYILYCIWIYTANLNFKCLIVQYVVQYCTVLLYYVYIILLYIHTITNTAQLQSLATQ